jgi:hypothetical protein
VRQINSSDDLSLEEQNAINVCFDQFCVFDGIFIQENQIIFNLSYDYALIIK